MAQAIINLKDFRDSAITDAKIVPFTISGTKVAAPITATSFSNFSISLSKAAFAHTPNMLRNGGFDENTSFAPTGWTRNNILTGAMAGLDLGDQTNAGTLQDSGFARCIKISGPTSGPQYELYQDVPLTAMGWGNINDSGTNGNFDISLSFNYNTTATAYVRFSYYVNAGLSTTVTFSNASIITQKWRSGTIGSIQPAAPNGTPTITAKVELGLDGASGGDYVYFDNIILSSNIGG